MQFERWSLPVIGEVLLRGATRRDEFLSLLGVAPDLLDARLSALVAADILSVETETDGATGYVPTEKGRGLEASIRALDEWSRRWDPLSTEAVLDIIDAIAPPADADRPAPATGPAVIEMAVLDTFELRVDGVSDDLSQGSQRLLVLLALRDRAIARIALAGTMWPAVSDGHAGDSLRAAISRLEAPARAAIRSSSTGLRLAENVAVDLHEAQSLAQRLIHGSAMEDSDVSSTSIAALSRDLLPDWFDDWVLAEAEDWRYLRMNALEALSKHLLDRGLFGEAATAARAAIRIDPLRESPQAVLIRAQLAMGNQSAAVDAFGRYRTLLHTAVGLEPTEQLADLVGDVGH